MRYNEVMANNKKRLLKLLEILRRNSDQDHSLTLNELISLLEGEGITVHDRKTLYDDIAVLSEEGYDIEYDGGYSLAEAPFSLAEVKILSDSVSSLRSLENSFKKDLQDKLYRFLSRDEEALLRSLDLSSSDSSAHFLHRLEDALEAVKKRESVLIQRKRHKEEEIFPLFLHRQNDYYYLYYHYPENEKIYHTRFDNLLSLSFTGKTDPFRIPLSRIREMIEGSTDSYFAGKNCTVRFEILEDSDYLRSRLSDDFPNVVFSRSSFSIRTSVNHLFFSRIAGYRKQIKISDPKIAEEFLNYLNELKDIYLP